MYYNCVKTEKNILLNKKTVTDVSEKLLKDLLNTRKNPYSFTSIFCPN